MFCIINPNNWESGIYKIVSPTGHYYVGSAVNLIKRCKQHYKHLVCNKHINPYMQSVFSKHPDGWQFITILEVNAEEFNLKEKEQEFINMSLGDVMCMNINKTSSRPPSQKGRIPWNKGTKGVMKAWNKGIPKPQDVKDKIRESLKGRKAPERSQQWKDRQEAARLNRIGKFKGDNSSTHNKKWMSNGTTNKRVPLDTVTCYLSSGWIFGTIKTYHKQITTL